MIRCTRIHMSKRSIQQFLDMSITGVARVSFSEHSVFKIDPTVPHNYNTE